MAQCVNCKTELGAGTKFCPACGTMQPVEQPVQQPQQPQYEQPVYQQPVQQTYQQQDYQQQTYQQQGYQQQAYQQPYQQPVQPVREPSPDDKYRYLAGLSYLSLIALIVLGIFAGKDSKYFRHHANQVVALYIWFLACGVVMIIPVLGWIAGGIGWIVGAVFMIIAVVKAIKCQDYVIPVFGKIQIIPEA